MCSSLRDQTARYRFLSMHYADSTARDVPDEHRQLMNAALAKDVDKACELLALSDHDRIGAKACTTCVTVATVDLPGH